MMSLKVLTKMAVQVCVCVCNVMLPVCCGRGNAVFHQRKVFFFFFLPSTLLSRLFVLVLITALRAATETPLAFMRLMKVSDDESGAALLLCVCVRVCTRMAHCAYRPD